MRVYEFAIYGEGESPIDVKTATLPDDNSAWDYAEGIIPWLTARRSAHP
jgi:hypothetical protein